jgi:3-hydroxyacyl-[acyl-carrier-protein] dehydratase
MTNSADRALELLPHGPEFRFVDSLKTLKPGAFGIGEYRVRGDESYLKGHFPGDPLVPGVLLLEAGAQLAGIVAQSDQEQAPILGLKLAAVRNARFTGTAHPGEVVTLEARITGRLGLVVQADIRALVGSREVLRGAVTLGGEATH